MPKDYNGKSLWLLVYGIWYGPSWPRPLRPLPTLVQNPLAGLKASHLVY